MTSANSTAFEPLGNLSRLDDLVKQLLPDVCCYEGQASGARSALGGNAADHGHDSHAPFEKRAQYILLHYEGRLVG